MLWFRSQYRSRLLHLKMKGITDQESLIHVTINKSILQLREVQRFHNQEDFFGKSLVIQDSFLEQSSWPDHDNTIGLSQWHHPTHSTSSQRSQPAADLRLLTLSHKKGQLFAVILRTGDSYQSLALDHGGFDAALVHENYRRSE